MRRQHGPGLGRSTQMYLINEDAEQPEAGRRVAIVGHVSDRRTGGARIGLDA